MGGGADEGELSAGSVRVIELMTMGVPSNISGILVIGW